MKEQLWICEICLMPDHGYGVSRTQVDSISESFFAYLGDHLHAAWDRSFGINSGFRQGVTTSRPLTDEDAIMLQKFAEQIVGCGFEIMWVDSNPAQY